MSTPAHDRTKYLGGSDVAAVLGVSDWATPVELWQQKVGLAANEPDPARQRIFARGQRLEPVICEMVVDKLRDEGHDVEVLARNQRYYHPKFKFLTAEIDLELRIDGEEVNGDAKSVNWSSRKKWGEVGSEDVPIVYAAQFMHGLDVTPGRRRRCLAAALRSFDDVDIYWTVRDDDTIEAIRAKLVDFWENHVVTQVAPDPEKFSDISALFQHDDGRSIEATEAIVEKVDALREIATLRKALNREEEELKFDIAQFMGAHALLTRGVRNLITWETGEIERLDLRSFKSKHPDWYALFKKSTRQRVMRIAGAR